MKALLVVDGYNVIGATERYRSLIDESADDPFERARWQLVTDVATFAQRAYEAHVIFDGAGNVSPLRPVVRQAGVAVEFSATGESADEVIERLAQSARRSGRETCVVTSDNVVRATVGGVPVTTISSTLLAHEIDVTDAEVAREAAAAGRSHMTVEDRLSPAQRAKLDALLGR